jgi:hypothetical protein
VPGEQFTRIVVDQTGTIVMIAHLDNAVQYQDAAFTGDGLGIPGCANADMSRAEHDALVSAQPDDASKQRALLQLAAAKIPVNSPVAIAIQTKLAAIANVVTGP